MRVRPFAAAAVAILALVPMASCNGSGNGNGGTLDGVGRIPGNDFVGVATLPPDIAADVSIPALNGAMLGAVAKGNRLLMIGDSILSSIAKRYGNEACSLLVPQGWNVALEAEAGQFAEFGMDVLNKRWDEGWDAVLLELGTNYDGNKDRYRRAMDKIFATIGETPVIVMNTTVFRDKQKEVNAIIDELVAAHPNATLLDWAAISAVRSVRGGDGIHPSPAGRVVLATAIARAAGVAPTKPGDCMKVYFQDDSRVLRDVMPSANDTTIPPSSVTSTVPTAAPSSTAVATSVAGVTTTAGAVPTSGAPVTSVAPVITQAPATTNAAPSTTTAG